MENNTEYYEQIFLAQDDLVWEKAPGKEVLIAALKRLVADGSIKRDARIIDIGCGTGYFLDRVQGEVGAALSCVGVDISGSSGNRVGDLGAF